MLLYICVDSYSSRSHGLKERSLKCGDAVDVEVTCRRISHWWYGDGPDLGVSACTLQKPDCCCALKEDALRAYDSLDLAANWSET